MNVLVVEPGFLPYEKEINGLAEMQKTVGGLIQAIYPFQEEVALVCNENGIFEGLEFNRSIPERSYEPNFNPLTPEPVKTYKERFNKAQVLTAMNGDKPFTIKVDADPKYPSERPRQPRKPPTR